MVVAVRTEVGTCDLGNVFIFAQTSEDGARWMVRAGNHTIGHYDTEAGAEAVARTLCGDQRLANEYIAEAAAEPCANCPHAKHEGVACAYRTADYYCDCGRAADAEVPEVEPDYVAPTRAKVSKK